MYLNLIFKIYKFSSERLKFNWNLTLVIYILSSISELFIIKIVGSLFDNQTETLYKFKFKFLDFFFNAFDHISSNYSLLILIVIILLRIISDLQIAKTSTIFCAHISNILVEKDINLKKSLIDYSELNNKLRESTRNGFICFNNIILSLLTLGVLFVYTLLNARPVLVLIVLVATISNLIEFFITNKSNKYRNYYLKLDNKSEEDLQIYRSLFYESHFGNFKNNLLEFVTSPFKKAHKYFFYMLGLKNIPNKVSELLIIIIVIILFAFTKNITSENVLLYLVTSQRLYKYYATLTANRIAIKNNIPVLEEYSNYMKNNFKKNSNFRQNEDSHRWGNSKEGKLKINLMINERKINIEEIGLYTITGQSGSGKTMLLKSIAGILNPEDFNFKYSVNINAKNQVLSSKDPNYYQKIREFVWYDQQFPKKVSKNLVSDVVLSDFIDTKSKKEKVADLIQDLYLNPNIDNLTFNPSGGELKRIAIARGLLFNKKIYLLDEPTSGLDPLISKKLSDYLKEFSFKKNVIIIATTHDNYLIKISNNEIKL